MFKYTMPAALLLLVSATAAFAQTAGTYTGTTADGQNVSFTVTEDATGGTYSITSENIAFSAPCTNSSTTLNTAWGTGVTVPITNGIARLALQDSYFFFSGTLHFNKTEMSGQLASYSPDLNYNTGGHPTRALFCISPAQAVTGTRTTTAAGAATSAGQPKAMLFRSQSAPQQVR